MAIFRLPTAPIGNTKRVVITIEFIYLRAIATIYLRVGSKLSRSSNENLSANL